MLFEVVPYVTYNSSTDDINEKIEQLKTIADEVNAKSIMAIFSLNLLELVNVCLYCDDSNVIEKFIKDMEGFE